MATRPLWRHRLRLVATTPPLTAAGTLGPRPLVESGNRHGHRPAPNGSQHLAIQVVKGEPAR
jgi:hypothetical protein